MMPVFATHKMSTSFSHIYENVVYVIQIREWIQRIRWVLLGRYTLPEKHFKNWVARKNSFKIIAGIYQRNLGERLLYLHGKHHTSF